MANDTVKSAMSKVELKMEDEMKKNPFFMQVSVQKLHERKWKPNVHVKTFIRGKGTRSM